MQIKSPISAITLQQLFDAALKEHAVHARMLTMWEEEVRAEIVVATCVYGYPSAVIQFYSIGNGITAEQWAPYGKGLQKPELFTEMYLWIAQVLNDRASGKLFATGTTSDFVLLE